jgi:hypothetical protein
VSESATAVLLREPRTEQALLREQFQIGPGRLTLPLERPLGKLPLGEFPGQVDDHPLFVGQTCRRHVVDRTSDV